MSMPRKLVHHGCCANYYFSQRKYQNLFKRNRKFERAYKQLSRRYNDLKSQNTEIIRQLQEQKVLNRHLEKELHTQNSVWMNHATSMEHVQMKELLGTLHDTFSNMVSHTVELTRHMSNGKSVIDSCRFSMRNNCMPNNRPTSSSNNDMPKPTSKTAPIRPMVQGYTVHQPSIFLQRCNVPLLEEELRINNRMENDDSDRLPTIVEESNSDIESSPVSTNMTQESINIVENGRKRRSRLGRLGYRSSTNCRADRTLFGGNSRAERNSSNEEELRDSTGTFSVMNDVINLHRSSAPFTSTSPNFRIHASSHCDREPVVKLHKLDNIAEYYGTSPSRECHEIIEEVVEEEEEEEEEATVAGSRAAAAARGVTEVDPLEGSSWMYGNNYTPNRKSRRNVSFVIYDDDDDDDDVEIVKPSTQPETNCSQSNVGVSINSTSESTEFTGFDNDDKIGGSQSLDTLNRLIDNMQHEASDQNATDENSEVEVIFFDSHLVEQIVKKDISSTSSGSSPEKTGFDDVDTEVVSSGNSASKKKENPTCPTRKSARKNVEQNTTISPARSVKLEANVFENGNLVTEVLSEEEDDVPIRKLMKKVKPTSPRKRSAGNKLDNFNREILNIECSKSGLERESVDSEPPGNLFDCSTITKRRKRETTPASKSKNESIRASSNRETPKESMKKKVSQESNQNSSTASNFDEFGYQKLDRSRRNKVVPCYKEVNLLQKLRR